MNIREIEYHCFRRYSTIRDEPFKVEDIDIRNAKLNAYTGISERIFQEKWNKEKLRFALTSWIRQFKEQVRLEDAKVRRDSPIALMFRLAERYEAQVQVYEEVLALCEEKKHDT